MKNGGKRILSLFLAALMLLGCLPVMASAKTFSDVKPGSWYYEAVSYVTDIGLYAGVGGGKFDPNGNMTRGMFITVLGRKYGVPEDYGTDSGFTDVRSRDYYARFVKWGKDNGIISGVGNNKFAPNATVTREQIATMLYNYIKHFGGNDSIWPERFNKFKDKDKVSSWAIEGMQWATDKGLIAGVGNNTLAPKMTATRAQVAQIFYNADFILGDLTNKPDVTPSPEPTPDNSPEPSSEPTEEPSSGPSSTPKPVDMPILTFKVPNGYGYITTQDNESIIVNGELGYDNNGVSDLLLYVKGENVGYITKAELIYNGVTKDVTKEVSSGRFETIELISEGPLGSKAELVVTYGVLDHTVTYDIDLNGVKLVEIPEDKKPQVDIDVSPIEGVAVEIIGGKVNVSGTIEDDLKLEFPGFNNAEKVVITIGDTQMDITDVIKNNDGAFDLDIKNLPEGIDEIVITVTDSNGLVYDYIVDVSDLTYVEPAITPNPTSEPTTEPDPTVEPTVEPTTEPEVGPVLEVGTSEKDRVQGLQVDRVMGQLTVDQEGITIVVDGKSVYVKDLNDPTKFTNYLILDLNVTDGLDDISKIKVVTPDGEELPVSINLVNGKATVVLPMNNADGELYPTLDLVIEYGDSETKTYTLDLGNVELVRPGEDIHPDPTKEPEPTVEPTEEPEPTTKPTEEPGPTSEPTEEPGPTSDPTDESGPTTEPTEEPEPTTEPTDKPIDIVVGGDDNNIDVAIKDNNITVSGEVTVDDEGNARLPINISGNTDNIGSVVIEYGDYSKDITDEVKENGSNVNVDLDKDNLDKPIKVIVTLEDGTKIEYIVDVSDVTIKDDGKDPVEPVDPVIDFVVQKSQAATVGGISVDEVMGNAYIQDNKVKGELGYVLNKNMPQYYLALDIIGTGISTIYTETSNGNKETHQVLAGNTASILKRVGANVKWVDVTIVDGFGKTKTVRLDLSEVSYESRNPQPTVSPDPGPTTEPDPSTEPTTEPSTEPGGDEDEEKSPTLNFAVPSDRYVDGKLTSTLHENLSYTVNGYNVSVKGAVKYVDSENYMPIAIRPGSLSYKVSQVVIKGMGAGEDLDITSALKSANGYVGLVQLNDGDYLLSDELQVVVTYGGKSVTYHISLSDIDLRRPTEVKPTPVPTEKPAPVEPILSIAFSKQAEVSGYNVENMLGKAILQVSGKSLSVEGTLPYMKDYDGYFNGIALDLSLEKYTDLESVKMLINGAERNLTNYLKSGRSFTTFMKVGNNGTPIIKKLEFVITYGGGIESRYVLDLTTCNMAKYEPPVPTPTPVPTPSPTPEPPIPVEKIPSLEFSKSNVISMQGVNLRTAMQNITLKSTSSGVTMSGISPYNASADEDNYIALGIKVKEHISEITNVTVYSLGSGSSEDITMELLGYQSGAVNGMVTILKKINSGDNKLGDSFLIVMQYGDNKSTVYTVDISGVVLSRPPVIEEPTPTPVPTPTTKPTSTPKPTPTPTPEVKIPELELKLSSKSEIDGINVAEAKGGIYSSNYDDGSLQVQSVSGREESYLPFIKVGTKNNNYLPLEISWVENISAATKIELYNEYGATNITDEVKNNGSYAWMQQMNFGNSLIGDDIYVRCSYGKGDYVDYILYYSNIILARPVEATPTPTPTATPVPTPEPTPPATDPTIVVSLATGTDEAGYGVSWNAINGDLTMEKRGQVFMGENYYIKGTIPYQSVGDMSGDNYVAININVDQLVSIIYNGKAVGLVGNNAKVLMKVNDGEGLGATSQRITVTDSKNVTKTYTFYFNEAELARPETTLKLHALNGEDWLPGYAGQASEVMGTVGASEVANGLKLTGTLGIEDGIWAYGERTNTIAFGATIQEDIPDRYSRIALFCNGSEIPQDRGIFDIRGNEIVFQVKVADVNTRYISNNIVEVRVYNLDGSSYRRYEVDLSSLSITTIPRTPVLSIQLADSSLSIGNNLTVSNMNGSVYMNDNTLYGTLPLLETDKYANENWVALHVDASYKENIKSLVYRTDLMDSDTAVVVGEDIFVKVCATDGSRANNIIFTMVDAEGKTHNVVLSLNRLNCTRPKLPVDYTLNVKNATTGEYKGVDVLSMQNIASFNKSGNIYNPVGTITNMNVNGINGYYLLLNVSHTGVGVDSVKVDGTLIRTNDDTTVVPVKLTPIGTGFRNVSIQVTDANDETVTYTINTNGLSQGPKYDTSSEIDLIVTEPESVRGLDASNFQKNFVAQTTKGSKVHTITGISKYCQIPAYQGNWVALNIGSQKVDSIASIAIKNGSQILDTWTNNGTNVFDSSILVPMNALGVNKTITVTLTSKTGLNIVHSIVLTGVTVEGMSTVGPGVDNKYRYLAMTKSFINYEKPSELGLSQYVDNLGCTDDEKSYVLSLVSVNENANAKYHVEQFNKGKDKSYDEVVNYMTSKLFRVIPVNPGDLDFWNECAINRANAIKAQNKNISITNLETALRNVGFSADQAYYASRKVNNAW